MTDEERKAMEWLDKIFAYATASRLPGDEANARTIKAMLARRAYDTEMREAWHVEFAEWNGLEWDGLIDVMPSKEEADERAALHINEDTFVCVRVTGPHQHEVPVN